MRNIKNLPIVLTLILFVSLGCLGPSASDSRCIGTINFEGQTFVGKAKDENQAALNACNKFCAETDADFNRMYEKWLDTDEAKKFEKTFKRKPTKEDAAIESKTLLDYVTKNCAVRCVNEANKNKHTLKTNCGS